MWGDWSYGGGGWGHWFFPVLILIVVIFVMRMISYRLGWRGGRHGHYPYGHGHGDSALDILRQRYARGELNKDEFERMRKDLGS
jgi:putative membrane protein